MKEVMLLAFGWMAIACALGVVFFKNPVYSAFSLILCFFALSGVYVVWGATFVAMVQILIYTGAIVVLFVFVIMLLDIGRLNVGPGPGWLTLSITGAAVWLFSLLLLRTLNQATFYTSGGTSNGNDLRTIAKLLYVDYLWPFEVLSFFLLALIVAIFALTRPEASGGER